MPHIHRSERVIPAEWINVLNVTPQGLANQHGPNTAILPIQVMAFPFTTSPYTGAQAFQLKIGDVTIADTGDIVPSLNDNKTMNLVNASGVYSLGGWEVDGFFNQPLRLWATGGIGGGAGQLLVVTVFHIIYMPVPL